MKLPKLSLTIAALGALLAVCTASHAQIQNPAGAGGWNAAATGWGAADPAVLNSAGSGAGAMGQGADSADATPARAADAGASKWTAGSASFSEAGSGGWTVGKGSFGAGRGASWTAGGQGFGEHVQRGGVWRVDSSLSPAGAVGFGATSLTGPGESAKQSEASVNENLAQPAPVVVSAPSGHTTGRAHGYGHSGVHAALAGQHRAAGAGSRGRTAAAHAVSHRSAGFGKTAGATGAPPQAGLPGDLNTPSLLDPALSNSGLNDAAPHDSLGLGLPQ